MKCTAVGIAMVALLAVMAPAQAGLIAVGDQLIINGDMENQPSGQPPAGWSKGSGGWETYTNAALGGTLGLAGYYNGWGFQDHWYDGFAPNVTSLLLTGWMRSEDISGGVGSMSVETYSMPGYQAGEYAGVGSDGTTTWKQYSVSVPVHHGVLETNYISVTLRNTNGATVHFDNITLTAVPEPAGFALLACGAAALVAYAWRKQG